MSTHSPRVRTRPEYPKVSHVSTHGTHRACAAKPPSCACACKPCRAHIPAFTSRPPRRKTSGAPAPPPPTVDAVDDTSTPPLTAGVSTPSTRGQYVEHPRVLSRCTHLPALRCAADDSAADSATLSHAVIAQPHLSVSSKAEPSTDPNERTPQPGSAPPAAAAGGAALVGDSGRRRPVSSAPPPCRPFLLFHARTPRHYWDHSPLAHFPLTPIPPSADSHCGRFALRPRRRKTPGKAADCGHSSACGCATVAAVAGTASAPTMADAARPHAQMQPGGRAAPLATAAHGSASRQMLEGPRRIPLAFPFSHCQRRSHTHGCTHRVCVRTCIGPSVDTHVCVRVGGRVDRRIHGEVR
jgi:hypothetical protein